MKTISSFMIVMLMVVLGITCFSSDKLAIDTISNEKEPSFELVIPDDVQRNINEFGKLLSSSNEDLTKFLYDSLIDNNLSSGEIREIKNKIDKLKLRKQLAKQELGLYFWKIDSAVLSSVDFNENLFSKYFSPMFWQRDVSDKIRTTCSLMTRKEIHVEWSFNGTLFLIFMAGFILGLILMFVGIRYGSPGDQLGLVGLAIAFPFLGLLLLGLCGL